MQVLAVRLYSGPAFQPINEFLRQVGRLTGEIRLQMARHPNVTFAATVGLLCSAIRKLAAVRPKPRPSPSLSPYHPSALVGQLALALTLSLALTQPQP